MYNHFNIMEKLVVIAEKEELKLVEKLGFSQYPVLITGVGALNVINALNGIPRDTHIINIGYAGSKNLEPGRFYAVDKVTLYHPNVDYKEPVYGLQLFGYVEDGAMETKKCLTGCDFVLQSDVKGCLFDMELAYIKALGFNIVVSYKFVSDNLDLQEYRKQLNEKK